MSKNIKEIGKELLGKSLNSFHIKTGLPQLERNNEMQDGILNGILSQVDDAYIEKTEQSNVIHLDGSGDGVVVLDSIEGNTLVNLCNKTTHTIIGENSNSWSKHIYLKRPLVVGNIYTLIVNVKSYTLDAGYSIMGRVSTNQNIEVQYGLMYEVKKAGIHTHVFTAQKALDMLSIADESNSTSGESTIEDFILLEGNYRNKEINFFEGLQSSFEEKVEYDKYKIEILMKNKNLYNVEDVNIGSWMNSGGATVSKINNNIVLNGTISDYFDFRTVQSSWNANLTKLINKLPTGTTLTMSNNLTSEKNTINYWSVRRDGVIKYFTNTLTIQKGDTEIGGFVRFQNGTVLNNTILKVQIEVNNKATSNTISKQNKIKLLINEPLRAVGSIKDKLCVKDGKLMIERNIFEFIEDGSNDWSIFDIGENRQFYKYIPINLIKKSVNEYSKITSMSNNYGKTTFNERGNITSRNCALMTYSNSNNTNLLCIYKPLDFTTEQLKTELNNSPLKMCYQLAEPFYEEITNEYGEPILLEGYENGTLYIDSAIVPTTTVRYTPKMESFNTLKEVYKNNVMLTSDVNDNIIPYMMEVDLMIMEKEMALPSQINIRKMEVLDMTSMQKRTQDMLERLIKGKSLTEQECKTRVTTYLNAGKITDEQAEELMLLIDEVYA